jgi:hypothetical protein
MNEFSTTVVSQEDLDFIEIGISNLSFYKCLLGHGVGIFAELQKPFNF